MNIKLKPPCRVRIKGTDKVLNLRSVSYANSTLKRQGWKGLVAHVQNRNGTGLIAYEKLEKAE